MKFLFDFFPILLFFITFKFYGDVVSAEETLCALSVCIPGGKEGAMYAATLVAIVATIAQVAIMWFKQHRVEKMHIITLALVVVLGGATIIFKNETFFKWKPTVVNWLFAVVFLASQWVMGKKPVVQRMMEKAITLNDPSVWLRLNMIWVVFFVAMGFVNLYVAYNFSTEIWVDFKLFGLMGLTLLFVIGQAFYLSRYIVPEEETEATAESAEKTKVE